MQVQLANGLGYCPAVIEVRVMAVEDRGSHASIGMVRLACFTYWDCMSTSGRRRFNGGPVWELLEPIAR